MAHVLGIDAGTTGVTALLVDDGGRVVAKGYREFPQSFPRPGWVEHDPEEWWTALTAACVVATHRPSTARSTGPASRHAASSG